MQGGTQNPEIYETNLACSCPNSRIQTESQPNENFVPTMFFSTQYIYFVYVWMAFFLLVKSELYRRINIRFIKIAVGQSATIKHYLANYELLQFYV